MTAATDAPTTLESLPGKPDRVHLEKIGNKDWELRELELNVNDDVALWSDNPRLQTTVTEAVSNELELEQALRRTPGYDQLKKSINEIGQMTPIYVQRTKTGKYLVLEGATRVTILRELDRKYKSGKNEGVYRTVVAKVLPPEFGEKDVAILLAGIHVRGSGVRSWGRYIEAGFVYDTVVGSPGSPPLMNQAQLAENMGRSETWVARLKSAYEFARKFIEHIDDHPNAQRLAADKFSVLEEISKARGIGPQIRDYGNSAFDDLRGEVFDMVRNNVFKEYRDARFLKEFHDDPDSWQQLTSGEEHIANKLARQVQDQNSGPKARIAGITQAVKRAIDRGDGEFDDEDVASLQQTIDLIEDQVHDGVHPYRLALKKAARTLNKASRADVLDLSASDIAEFRDAYEYFDGLVSKHGGPST
ncbi:MAG: hypothetical protein ACE37M_07940 [Henriciella sp.]